MSRSDNVPGYPEYSGRRMKKTTGTIIKAQSGRYEVFTTEKERLVCLPRGKLRLGVGGLLVGDHVRVECRDGKNLIEEVYPRTGSFVRPAVANVDQLILFSSGAIPITDPYLIDRVCVTAAMQNVSCVLVVNKIDLDEASELRRIYGHVGLPVIPTCAIDGRGIDELRTCLAGKISVFTGNSGVGKSSILNALEPGLGLRVAEISKKLGRGRHTTRHVELYPLSCGGWVADTPGFASFDAQQIEPVPADELPFAFPEFAPFLGHCRFRDCAHRSEPDCAVTAALREGKIEPTRYASYCRLRDLAVSQTTPKG